MLTGFSVANFKAFSKKIDLCLDSPGNYEFNNELIQNGVITKAMVYGYNGCGKSALGLALFDIILHITDKRSEATDYYPYHNLDVAIEEPVSFEYRFRFEESTVIYRYEKKTLDILKKEVLEIDDKTVIEYDHETQEGRALLEGAETLNLKSDDSTISRVKYVRRSAVLEENHENLVFKKFIDFVDKMLLFYSLDFNRYRGFTIGSESIGKGIIDADKVSEFERFLHENNVSIRLDVRELDGEKTLMARYKNSDVEFFKVASTGTRSLALFYYWYIKMEKASLVFMDEFDAFYHFELAKSIVELLKPLKETQVIITTHNTDLLSNDLLRPDCYFWLHESKLDPLCQLTDKELRKAHNLQKMFKAGAFL